MKTALGSFDGLGNGSPAAVGDGQAGTLECVGGSTGAFAGPDDGRRAEADLLGGTKEPLDEAKGVIVDRSTVGMSVYC